MATRNCSIPLKQTQQQENYVQKGQQKKNIKNFTNLYKYLGFIKLNIQKYPPDLTYMYLIVVMCYFPPKISNIGQYSKLVISRSFPKRFFVLLF